MAEPVVLYEVKDRIATVTLNRPDRLNAFNAEMGAGLRQAMETAARDADVRVIILTGAGRGFCAGADMERLSGAAGGGGASIPPETPAPLDLGWPARADFQHRYSYFPAIPKPVIAAVNGPAAGLGFVFACYCDIRFAGSEAIFTTAFSRRGLIAEYGLAWLLPRLVGRSAAADLLLSGRTIDAAEALRIGLVTAVVDPAALLGHANSYARELAQRCSPRSLAVIKEQLSIDADSDRTSSFDRSIRLMLESFTAPDLNEAIAAGRDDRPTQFPPLGPLETL